MIPGGHLFCCYVVGNQRQTRAEHLAIHCCRDHWLVRSPGKQKSDCTKNCAGKTQKKTKHTNKQDQRRHRPERGGVSCILRQLQQYRLEEDTTYPVKVQTSHAAGAVVLWCISNGVMLELLLPFVRVVVASTLHGGTCCRGAVPRQLLREACPYSSCSFGSLTVGVTLQH